MSKPSIFHLCRFNQWTDPIQTYDSNKQQWRTCCVCNKAQFRTLGWDKQACVIAINDALAKVRAAMQGSK